MEIGDMDNNADRRRAAAALGLLRFAPVAPCKRGHNADRWVCNGGCVECGNYKVVRPNAGRAVFNHQVAHVPTLTHGQRVALQNYLGRCIVAWHEGLGLVAPIQPSKLQIAEIQGRPYTELG